MSVLPAEAIYRLFNYRHHALLRTEIAVCIKGIVKALEIIIKRTRYEVIYYRFPLRGHRPACRCGGESRALCRVENSFAIHLIHKVIPVIVSNAVAVEYRIVYRARHSGRVARDKRCVHRVSHRGIDRLISLDDRCAVHYFRKIRKSLTVFKILKYHSVNTRYYQMLCHN